MAKVRYPRIKLTKKDLQQQINDSNERYYKLESMLYALAEHCKCFIQNGPVVVPFDSPKAVDGA